MKTMNIKVDDCGLSSIATYKYEDQSKMIQPVKELHQINSRIMVATVV